VHSGDLREFDGIIAITTNGFVKRDRTCVMGRVRQALPKDSPNSPQVSVKDFRRRKPRLYFPEHGLITFPVKHNWWEAADLGLIERSARELLKIIEVKDQGGHLPPRPGCGNGRLKWENVKKILSPILKPDQFHIVTYNITES
jgi:hypothetical protein